MKTMTLTRSLLSAALLPVTLLTAGLAHAESEATQLLTERSNEFRQDVVQVANNVYTFTGYSVQPVSMIIGDDGLVIVDTGLDTISAQKILTDMRKISDLPIQAIIFTHGHGDHTGGLPVFAADGSPEIWARHNLGDENHAFEHAGLEINNTRGARQGGFLLPPRKADQQRRGKGLLPETRWRGIQCGQVLEAQQTSHRGSQNDRSCLRSAS